MPFANPESKASHLASGKHAEEKAHRYLLAQGLKPVARNFRCPHGELDLLMLDGATLTVIEVRYRKNDRFGSAAETVTPAKQSRIIAATHYYLSQSPHYQQRPVRFDVVALSGQNQLDWIKNAFQ